MATAASSATISSRSPSAAPSASLSFASSSAVRNFAVGERQPSPSRNAQTRPFAPSSWASAISPSSSERGSSRLPAFRPLTTPPPSIVPRKTRNSVSRSGVGEVGQLHPEADVGAVGAVAGEGIVVGDARDRQLDVDAGGAEDVGDQPLVHLDHVLDLDEGHLDVELREVGLAVGAQVLVAEAAGDLVVALEPGDHQQLLEELRRLRERVEGGLLEPARDEEVTRALGRRAGQHRRLDLDEALAVELLAHRPDQLRAELQRLAHLLPAQVQVAVAQPRLLADLAAAVALDLERRRLGRRRAARPRRPGPRSRRSGSRG